jgi:ABC-2 type transport system permease protein
MRAAVASHRTSTRFGVVSTVVLVIAGAVSALSSLLVGLPDYPAPAAGAAVVSVVVTVWVVGRVAYAAFSGGSGLRLELFRLLPIPRRELGRALLVTGLFDPALLVMAVAFAALIAFGAHGGAGPALIGALGALLTLLLTSVLVSVVEAIMPPASRQRQSLGTIVVAVVISLVAVVGTLLPSLAAALIAGDLPVLGVVLRILPTGWAADAVTGAMAGDALATVLPLAGAVVLVTGIAALWPTVLSSRLDGGLAATSRRRRTRARILPGTPVGGVVGKELRMWVRDPLRLTFLVIAAIIGLGVCAVPELSQGTGFLLPFAGILSAIIAGAGACNLYGSDGLALRLTLMVPGAERADVRGRQAAFLLLVGPYALVATVALTAISGQAWAWAWVLALLPAIVGGAAGLLPIASLVAVLPLDANGGPAPAWPVKVYAAMVLTLVAAAPTAAVLIVGAFAGSVATQWAAVPVGVASGVLAAVLLGRAATVRLGRRGVAIVEQLSAA